MVFKVVRTDTPDPRKIQLLVGTHLIGRGNLLDCDDKRVSRRHGELEVTQDGVSIKSLHINPCFYIRRSTDETVILKQECTVNLSQGDKFGLLPHTYWYELLHCMPDAGDSSSITEDVKKEINNTDNVNYETNTEDQVEESKNGSTDNIQNTPISNKSELNGHHEDPDISQPLSLELNDTVDKDNEALESPSLISTDNPTFNNDIVNEPSNVVASNDDQNVEAKILKRTSVTSDDWCPLDIKKVKAEPDDSQDVKPGPSNDDAPPSLDENVEAKIIKRSNSVTPDDAENAEAESDDSQDSPPADFSDNPQSPYLEPVARERCMYGENCYRRNLHHKSEFSHPTDVDWGDGERGVCPYGHACRRRDPRHWRDHTHPAGVEPPDILDAARPGVKKPRRRKNYSDEDNGSVKDLIVTGKRVRKTIARPSYSSSESGNDDPYQTDPESDEWQPGSNDLLSTQSYSQNTED